MTNANMTPCEFTKRPSDGSYVAISAIAAVLRNTKQNEDTLENHVTIFSKAA